jgi:hypothetical protein
MFFRTMSHWNHMWIHNRCVDVSMSCHCWARYSLSIWGSQCPGILSQQWKGNRKQETGSMPIPQASPGHRPTDQQELAVAPEVVPDPEKKQNEAACAARMNTAWAWTGRKRPQKALATTSRSKCICQKKPITSFPLINAFLARAHREVCTRQRRQAAWLQPV